GDAQAALDTAQALEQRRFLGGSIPPRPLQNDQALLRITRSAAHEETDIDHLLQALDELRLMSGAG
ncbi:MAG: 8-amino-7-oxononanoate synthase, partial [Delftia sp.]|nr:8-amino-7-oxononanoate synthase [Delftia sp.]